MYMYIQFAVLIFHVDFSNKKATSVPDDVWEVAMKAGVTSVNLSKNQFTDLPSKFVFLYVFHRPLPVIRHMYDTFCAHLILVFQTDIIIMLLNILHRY